MVFTNQIGKLDFILDSFVTRVVIMNFTSIDIDIEPFWKL